MSELRKAAFEGGRMLRYVLQHSVNASCRRRLHAPVLILGLLPLLAGCLVGQEKPATGLDIPDSYRNRVRNTDVALPKLDWWRGFRSKQLTDLIEESLTSNFDIAA